VQPGARVVPVRLSRETRPVAAQRTTGISAQPHRGQRPMGSHLRRRCRSSSRRGRMRSLFYGLPGSHWSPSAQVLTTHQVWHRHRRGARGRGRVRLHPEPVDAPTPRPCHRQPGQGLARSRAGGPLRPDTRHAREDALAADLTAWWHEDNGLVVPERSSRTGVFGRRAAPTGYNRMGARALQNGHHYALPPSSAFVFGGCIDSGRSDAERR
jgi:hypothetical protein